jgi:hypothetical protein
MITLLIVAVVALAVGHELSRSRSGATDRYRYARLGGYALVIGVLVWLMIRG